MIDDPGVSAAVLEREAARLDAVLDPVVMASGPDTWQGPAADQFAAGLDEKRRRLRAVADDLRAAARRQLVQRGGDAAVAPVVGAPMVGFGPRQVF